MYHIKADKRCRKSAKKICDALRALLLVKPLTDITVSDIQRVSGIGRSTFYRLFDNIDDVLLYLIEEEYSDLVERYQVLSWHEFTSHFIESVVAESRELVNIAASGKMYILSHGLRTKITQEAEEGHYKFDNISRYSIAMFVGCCLSLVTAWNEEGRVEPIEELADMMQTMLNYKKIEENLRRPEAEALQE